MLYLLVKDKGFDVSQRGVAGRYRVSEIVAYQNIKLEAIHER